jgi:hypothetical protein
MGEVKQLEVCCIHYRLVVMQEVAYCSYYQEMRVYIHYQEIKAYYIHYQVTRVCYIHYQVTRVCCIRYQGTMACYIHCQAVVFYNYYLMVACCNYYQMARVSLAELEEAVFHMKVWEVIEGN